jgi:hypothetical protein
MWTSFRCARAKNRKHCHQFARIFRKRQYGSGGVSLAAAKSRHKCASAPLLFRDDADFIQENELQSSNREFI